ncbi:MAG: TolC family protein [Gemmatimonadales bacterium]
MAGPSLGRVVGLWAGIAVGATTAAPAQLVADRTPLDSLVALALRENQDLRAMESRAEAFEARIGPAGAWDDPQLMMGVMNLPLPSFDFDGTPMTQAAAVQLRQTIPFPGKLRLRTAAAEAEYATVSAEFADRRFQIATSVRAAYYDLYAVEHSLGITRRHQELLSDFVRVANVRYSVGSGLQQDVLKANVELGRVRERLLQQLARREAAVARLNALVNRSPETPIQASILPSRLVELAFAGTDTSSLKFASASAQASDIPSLSELVELAIEQRPILVAHRTRIERQELLTDLARKNLWPDFMFSIGYGYRGAGLEDFISANVGIQLPIFAGRKQKPLIAAARAAADQAETTYRETVNQITARLADLRARMVTLRAQLVLYRDGIVPQAAAALQSAISAYQVGNVDFLTLVTSEATLYRYELDYHTLLAAFLSTVAEMELTVGREIFSNE